MIDSAYKYITIVLNTNNSEGAIKLPFIREPNRLIFHLNSVIGDYTFISRRLYMLESYIKDILEIAYSEGYSRYAHLIEKAST